MLTRQAPEILAKLAAGHIEYALAYMYMEYTNNNTAAPTLVESAAQDYYAGLDGANKDFLRVPLLGGAEFETADVTNDTVYFVAMTGVTASGHHGLPFSQASGSKIIGAAIVAAPTGVFSGDLVYSRFYLSTPITKLNGLGVSLRYPLRFG